MTTSEWQAIYFDPIELTIHQAGQFPLVDDILELLVRLKPASRSHYSAR